MSTQQTFTGLQIKDEDRNIEFVFDVDVSLTSGCPAHYSTYHGWSPPEPPTIEIDEVRCQEVVTWLDDWAAAADVSVDEKHYGRLLEKKYDEEIRQVVSEAVKRDSEARAEA